MTKPTETKAWQTLRAHYATISQSRLRDLFEADSQRFEHFSLTTAELLLDYSKNFLNHETIPLLCDLARAMELPAKIEQLLTGDIVNHSENRPALHTALRHLSDEPIHIDDYNIMADVRTTQEKIAAIVNAIHNQTWLGYQQEPITDIVNIGIGGSELGPALAINALTPYAVNSIRFHFIANVDGSLISTTLKKLNPATTLFIISSKNFNTSESVRNAQTAKQWLLQAMPASAIKQHFLAVTAKPEHALAFGVASDNILPLWDWVGGRYSLWSAIGLPLAIAIGMKNFQQLLAGAFAMDQHFRSAPLEKNMPVILALISVWYINFFHTHSQAIVPYDYHLNLLPTYLQQAHMESHGKQRRRDGSPVDYPTGAVIWGGVGTNTQHTFHQLLHQGTHLIPVDFIIAANVHHSLDDHHELLFANCLSQSKALMIGKTEQEITTELIANGYAPDIAVKLAPHRIIPGNRPSNTIVLSQLTPFALGELIALYEHKIFTQSIIWDINCFDQWGVELGKQLATHILPDLQSDNPQDHDGSTQGLIDYYKGLRVVG